MDRFLVVVIVTAVAVVISAQYARRKRPEAPTRTGWTVPDQVDRADFARPGTPWLVAVFTSATCTTCADVWSKAELLGSDDVAVAELEYGRDRAVHERYGIDAVPTLLIADRDGVVQRSFLGPTSATHLWAALAELREPGSVPPGCGDH